MLNVISKSKLALSFALTLGLSSSLASAEGGRNGPDLGGQSIAVKLDRGISAKNASEAVSECFFGQTKSIQRKSAMALQIAQTLNKNYNVEINGLHQPMVWGVYNAFTSDYLKSQTVNLFLFENRLQGGRDLLGDAIFTRPELSYAGQLAVGSYQITGTNLKNQKEYVPFVNFYQEGNPSWSDTIHKIDFATKLVIKFSILSPNPDLTQPPQVVQDVTAETPQGFPTITYEKMVQTVKKYDEWGNAKKSEAQLFGLSIWVPDNFGPSVKLINPETKIEVPIAINMTKYVECLQGQLQSYDK